MDSATPQSRPSRVGRTLAVAQITITFENGEVEVWDFPPEARGYYREGRNWQNKPKYSTWRTHQLWWQSEKWFSHLRRQ